MILKAELRKQLIENCKKKIYVQSTCTILSMYIVCIKFLIVILLLTNVRTHQTHLSNYGKNEKKIFVFALALLGFSFR